MEFSFSVIRLTYLKGLKSEPLELDRVYILVCYGFEPFFGKYEEASIPKHLKRPQLLC